MLMLYAIVGLVFAAVAVMVAGYYQQVRETRLRQRVQRIAAPRLAVNSPLAQELQKSFYERVVAPILAELGERITKLTPGGAVESSRLKLEMAGNPASLTAASFMVLRALSLVVGLLGAVALLVLWREGLLAHRLGAAFLTALAGALLPDYAIESVIRQRQRVIQKSIPDIIDLLVVSAEAGTGLDGALAEVVRRKKGPLPDEFARVLTEIRLGKRRHEAWSDMAVRCGVEDLKNLVAALQQAEELGVSIANTLRTQADSIRTRRSMKIRTVAATLSVKMLFPLIFCIFPALFVVVLGPGVMSISKALTSLGW